MINNPISYLFAYYTRRGYPLSPAWESGLRTPWLISIDRLRGIQLTLSRLVRYTFHYSLDILQFKRPPFLADWQDQLCILASVVFSKSSFQNHQLSADRGYLVVLKLSSAMTLLNSTNKQGGLHVSVALLFVIIKFNLLLRKDLTVLTCPTVKPAWQIKTKKLSKVSNLNNTVVLFPWISSSGLVWLNNLVILCFSSPKITHR